MICIPSETVEKGPELFQKYNELIKKQIETGIVEKVPEGASCTLGKVHYLPYHPVIHRDKHTTKDG
jgi:hypothetical protein